MEIEQSKNERALWITLFPNRTVLWLWQLPLLPLLAFPRILVMLYAVMLGNESVSLKAGIGDPLLIGLILLLVSAILSVVSATKERALRLDPFPARENEDSLEDTDNEAKLFDESVDLDAFRQKREQQVLEFRRILNREQEPPSDEKKQ